MENLRTTITSKDAKYEQMVDKMLKKAEEREMNVGIGNNNNPNNLNNP